MVWLKHSGSWNNLSKIGLIIVFVAATLSIGKPGISADTKTDEMGTVEFELPDELGTLTFAVPSHWVGGNTEGVDALWIDQHASPFKDNVTLKIRPLKKYEDSEKLLDVYMNKLIENLDSTPLTETEESTGRRSMVFATSTSNLDLTQTVQVLYAESTDKSYLLVLNHSRLTTGEPLDLSNATIVN